MALVWIFTILWPKPSVHSTILIESFWRRRNLFPKKVLAKTHLRILPLILHPTLNLAVCIVLGYSISLIVELFTATETDLDLDTGA